MKSNLVEMNKTLFQMLNFSEESYFKNKDNTSGKN